MMRAEEAAAVDPAAIGRVMVLSHTHPSITKGGAEIASYTLYTGLRSLGVDAVFVAACLERDRPRLRLDTPTERIVIAEPMLYDDYYHIAAPAVLAQLRAIIAADRPDVLNFHHFMGFGLNGLRAVGRDARHARAAGERAPHSIVTLHEFLAICSHHGQMVTNPGRHLCEAASPNACSACFPQRTPEQFGIRHRFVLDALGEAAGFVSPSHFLADRFGSWGLPRERIAVIENGLRSTAGHDAQPQTEPHGDNRRWVFGFFGQLNPFKGIDVLLKAATLIERSPDLAERVLIRIHGNLVGQSAEFTERFQQAIASHSCLDYVGPYENSAVGRLMQSCDYVLMPSTWWENSPVVIQEAYLAKRPVLCSGIGGMAEKVRDGVSGLHFRVGDAGDLLRALRVAASSDTHARLRAGIPAVADSRRMAEDYIEAFRGFLAHPAEPVTAGAQPAERATARA